MVIGQRADAEALRNRVTKALQPIGLRLSEAKTQVVHVDEGFDFLGFRIQRKTQRGTNKRYVYTWPSKKALKAVKAKVRTLTNGSSARPPRATLLRINAVLRGWANYFRHAAAKRVLSYLDHYTWQRVGWWLRKRHGGLSWHAIIRRFTHNGTGYTIDGVDLFLAASTPVTRYRYRGTRIPSPWAALTPNST